MTREKAVHRTIESEAADWYLLMQSDETLAQEQLQLFIDWLKDPKAERAYSECETLWEVTGMLKSDPAIIASRKQNTELQSSIKNWWHQCSTPKRYGLQAACWVVVAMMFVALGIAPEQENVDIYQTATGQQKTITLVDGSQMILNTSSEVHVNYQKNARKVILESGEVLFDVAKDTYRPFSVVAGNGEVTALGTIFNIKKSVNQQVIEVALLEGKIEVNANIQSESNKTTTQKQVLITNELTSYNTKTITPVQKITDIEKITQWKEGRLSFTNASLAEVIEQVNRYTVNKLIIDGKSLQSEKINAHFVIGDTQTLLSALKETLDISWSYRTDGIVLYRSHSAG